MLLRSHLLMVERDLNYNFVNYKKWSNYLYFLAINEINHHQLLLTFML